MDESLVLIYKEKIKNINHLMEDLRSAFKEQNYSKCNLKLQKAINVIDEIVNHPELIPDNKNSIQSIAHNIEHIDIPILSGNYITTSNSVIAFPTYCNSASLCFYIQDMCRLFKKYAWSLRKKIGYFLR